jgi:hypothetical protein
MVLPRLLNSVKLKWFFQYLLIFFIIPIIGTLAHELGHYLVAVIYNQPAYISYAFTHIIPPDHLTPNQYFWFIMGGPLSTWITATAGIVIIIVFYRMMHNEKEESVGIGQTIALLCTSFSIRFIFNAGNYLIFSTILGNPSYSDEVKIAQFLGLSPDLLMYGSAVIALILILLALYFSPRYQRYIILIAGILGGILGYIFWYYWVGPIILP